MNVLDIPMGPNDANAATIRDYLKKLLFVLWCEGEGFSGKRPFGNSGWEYEVYSALVAAKAVKGSLDDYGDLEEVDTKAADKLVMEAIGKLY